MTEPMPDLIARLRSDAERHRPHMPDTVRLLREAADALEAQALAYEDLKREYDEKCERVHRLREAGNRLRKELDAHTKVCGCVGCDGAIAAWDALGEKSEGKKRMELRPEVQWFAEQMEQRLRQHDAERGGNSWKTADPPTLLRHLREKTNDLADTIACPAVVFDAGQAIKEAADVGNFAMMIADVARAYGRVTP